MTSTRGKTTRKKRNNRKLVNKPMSEIKNVVFMGTPDFAVGTLKALLNSRYQVTAVFTQPDKARGRSGKLQPTPVGQTALDAGIPVYRPVRIRNEENVEILRQLKPDVIVVAAFGQIIPQAILDIPPFGCINVHASLLPAYRGAAPIQWAVLNGDSRSGVTTMRMNAGLDTGDMILKEEVELAPDETAGTLFDKLSGTGAALLIRTLEAIEAGTAVYEKQPEKSTTAYAAMFTKQDGKIDWTADAVFIERKIRAMDPWPTAYTSLEGRQLKIWKAGLSQAEDTAGAVPGTILGVTGHSFLVQTGRGVLEVFSIQAEGKKRMDVDAFLRGNRIERGMILN